MAKIPETIKKLARGVYKKKECPYCNKMVGNLGNHVKMAHPAEAVKPETPALNKEILITPGAVKPTGEQSIVYACASCKAELRKGEVSCWNCGETLIWDGVE